MVVAHLLHKVRVSEEGLTVRREKHIPSISFMKIVQSLLPRTSYRTRTVSATEARTPFCSYSFQSKAVHAQLCTVFAQEDVVNRLILIELLGNLAACPLRESTRHISASFATVLQASGEDSKCIGSIRAGAL